MCSPPVLALDPPLEGLLLDVWPSDWGLTMDQLDPLASCPMPLTLVVESCATSATLGMFPAKGSLPTKHGFLASTLRKQKIPYLKNSVSFAIHLVRRWGKIDNCRHLPWLSRTWTCSCRRMVCYYVKGRWTDVPGSLRLGWLGGFCQ